MTITQSDVYITQAGRRIVTGVTSAYEDIPPGADGAIPSKVRIACTAACHVRFGHGGDGAATASLMAVSGVVGTAGTGHAPGDILTLTGGTSTTASKVAVATTKLVSAAVNAAGTGYVPADTIVPAGGSFTGSPLLTVTHAKAVSAAVVSGGTGGTPGAVTITGTTGTGTPFQATGTINGGGILAGALVVTVAGDYTANPTLVAVEPVTGGSLTGCTVILGMGVKTVTAAAGAYTVNAAALTQTSTSGPGAGATFNTLVYGVNTVTIDTAGKYSVIPANDVAQGASTGSGINAAITMAWGVGPITVTTPGAGYANSESGDFTLSGGGGSGASLTATFDGATGAIAGITAAPGTGYTSVPTIVVTVETVATNTDMLLIPGSGEVFPTQGFSHIRRATGAECRCKNHGNLRSVRRRAGHSTRFAPTALPAARSAFVRTMRTRTLSKSGLRAPVSACTPKCGALTGTERLSRAAWAWCVTTSAGQPGGLLFAPG
jgi:hypothetical protein